jgi:hypothetical protein
MSTSKKPGFIVLGPVNSGTNLIEKIMKEFGFIYKHPINKHDIDENRLIKAFNRHTEETIFIAMYKPLYNWIASVYKESYNIMFMNRPKNTVNTEFSILQYPVSFCQREFPSLLGLYNTYYQNYLSILRKGHKIVLLDYYKVINGIGGLMYVKRKIKEKYPLYTLTMDESQYLTILNQPSKRHGKSVNSYKEAMEKKQKNHMLYSNRINSMNHLKVQLNHQLYRQVEEITQ